MDVQKLIDESQNKTKRQVERTRVLKYVSEKYPDAVEIKLLNGNTAFASRTVTKDTKSAFPIINTASGGTNRFELRYAVRIGSSDKYMFSLTKYDLSFMQMEKMLNHLNKTSLQSAIEKGIFGNNGSD